MLGLPGRTRLERDPEAGRCIHLVAIDIDRSRKARLDALGHPRRIGRVRHPMDEQRELVSAQPRRGVAGPRTIQQPLGHRDQQRVTRSVTEAFVDGAKVIEIEQNHGERRRLASVARNGLSEALHEEHPVGQPGERIVEPLAPSALCASLAQSLPSAHRQRRRCRRSVLHEHPDFLWRPRPRLVSKNAE